MKIPITKPYFDENEENAIVETLKSGWVVQGPKVREFENLFKEFQDCKFALAVNSATSALHLALVALGIKQGDEVIVPAFTHPATANVVVHVGAVPVFVDIEIQSFNIDVSKIESKITKKTRAIIPVHLFGLPAEMDAILEIAKKYNLKIIEDAACALGAEYKSRKVGTIGDCGAFSFHPRKPITTGEGGMFTTDNEELAKKVEILRNHGENISDEIRHKAKEIIYPDYVFAGFNYRMTDVQGAIGVEQMKKTPFILKERLRIAQRYDELLKELEEKSLVIRPKVPEYMTHSYQSYVILLGEACKISRDELSNALQKRGVSTRKGTYNVPLTNFYREKFGFKSGDFPMAEQAEERSLALPLCVGMTEEEIVYVVEQLKGCLQKCAV